jgi:hypothetical protein
LIGFTGEAALIADARSEEIMQRLISFFHEPQDDDWPDPANVDAQPPPAKADDEKALKPEPKEPIYFAELMAYVRERNAKFRWPREGAD